MQGCVHTWYVLQQECRKRGRVHDPETKLLTLNPSPDENSVTCLGVQEPDNGEERADDDADNGVDAQKLLRALAREDSEVSDRVESLEPDVAAEVADSKPSRCAIM